jgi:hypothetical protein
MALAQASRQREITMTKVQINLPDQLAQEAQRAGLLTPATLERILHEYLKNTQDRRAVRRHGSHGRRRRTGHD